MSGLSSTTNTNGKSKPYRHGYSNSNRDSNRHRDGHRNTDCNRNAHCNCDGHPDGNVNCDAESYTHA